MLGELTVPWEDNVEEAYERKLTKYGELLAVCRDRGWKAACYPVEVGCRGFVASSLQKWLRQLGFTRREVKSISKSAAEAAETGSSWIWNNLKITCGLPQGTLLGPLIFLAYVNSAARSAASKHWKFVDDLNLLETRNPTSGPSNMQQDLNELSLWSQASHMKLHPKKCKVLHIQFRKIPVTPPSLTVNNIEVQQVKVLRVLGVILQADLKWNSHVDSVCTKANQRLYFLRKLKHFHPASDNLLTVYTSYIRPILEYAAPVWHSGLPNKLSDRIEKVQRRALRVILGAEYTSYAAACSHLGLPTLSSRRTTLTETFAKSLLRSGQLQHILRYHPPEEASVAVRPVHHIN
ncbi:hypothetical protein Bbelb_239570 [Branchiostoma belcheri]|nr:hypothetical protein Bbelb_239570 [Branchiostoma belcheri]